jgi:formylglycine-generating enzyme required for sulfatase activity
MIAIPGGSFRAAERVGPAAADVAWNRVAPFLLDATEVTVSEYAACVRAGRCTPATTTVEWEGMSGAERARWSAACNGDRADRADHPVNCVDWEQARAFCAVAGKRLPTEAEWEWAARGGAARTSYPWGDDAPEGRACWSGPGSGAAAGAARGGTCPVASHPRGATASGIQDLAGNVWEWTSTEDVVAADSRGRGGTPVRIARGGGFGDAAPGQLTAGVRAKDRPAWRGADLGFRCARSR